MGTGVSTGLSLGSVQGDNQFEKMLIEFFKNKMKMVVTTQWAGSNIETKVSLRLADTDEELLSDVDSVQVSND
jgi:hypothetical protein